MAGTINGQSNLVDNTFSWNPQNFAGFFYDIKKDLGTENLMFVLTEGKKLSGDSPYGITYVTTAQNKDYEHALWGSYKIIGFGAKKYFAGYNAGADIASDIFNAESTDKNSLSSEQLERILMDSKYEMTVTSGTPLKLDEGYELAIKSIDIDSNKVYLELSKNGAVVDSKIISPSKTGATEADKTYYYKDPAVGEQKMLVTIGVHFKNAFRGADSNLASIDGVWQISDTPTEVKADTQYDKMTIRTVDATAGSITMDNKDNAITLSKNKDTALTGDIKIRTADNDTSRFYIYKTLTQPGDYQIRGAVAGTVNGASNLVDNSYSWNPQTFAGFFYDIKKDLGTESLKFVLTGDNELSGDNPYGVTYTTTVQNKAFERDLWGSYKIIGFQAERYFAGYNQGVDEPSGSNIFYSESTDKNSLSSEQLERILVDDDSEMTITSGTPLMLREGYELAIKSIDIDGNKVYLELSKNGAVVDNKAISTSKEGATEADKTYYYRDPAVGEQKMLVTIGVHFKNAFRGADSNLASIDGVWQISDTPTKVKADTQYGKMTIRTVDATAGIITMDNKDNAITLSKNKDVVLMPGVSIQTADNDTLRFYIYKPVTIEGTAVQYVTATTTMRYVPEAYGIPVNSKHENIDTSAKENVTIVKAEKAAAIPKSGLIVFNPPTEMTRYKGEYMEARVGKENISSLTQDISGSGKVQIRYVDVTTNTTYVVNLTGDCFVIQEERPRKQKLVDDPNKYPRWIWYVTPKEEGDHMLILNVDIYVGDEATYVNVTKWPVHIAVLPEDKVKDAFNNISMIIGSLIVFLISIFTLLKLAKNWKKGDKGEN